MTKFYTRKRANMMNKLRFAVVGAHSIAKHHIDGINKLPQAELTAEIEDMCNVILNDALVECDVIESANTVAVCQAAVRSAATGKHCAPEYFS